MSYLLYTARGCGGAMVEVVLQKLKLPHDIRILEWGKFAEGDYPTINPLLQVPTLRLPSGEIMSESLAICTFLNARHQGTLVPDPQDRAYARYQRWSVFLVASIYPTFYYGDETSRWVTPEAAQAELKARTDQQREKMWLQMEDAAAGSRYFLGEQESLIDIFVAIMVHWRPRQEWFRKHAPKLSSIARRIADQPEHASTFAQFS
ncbi:MAG TPA: glutathione S-transferase family protein [Oligoflexus sp.]|nr:glutathione S-transferase family protein [Oligoflexus sp.]